MIDIWRIPLPDDLIITFSKMHVGFYHNHATGESFISRGWWNRADKGVKAGLAAIVTAYTTESHGDE